jgi:hypothetical protein
MDTKAAIVALLGVWSMGVSAGQPVMAQEAEDVAAPSAAASNPLLNRVWVQQDDGSGLPGRMQIFLADGTLVSDSCWETYRLSRWQQVSDTEIAWDEDGATITAAIASVSADELVLTLKLVDGEAEQRFTPATVPYVCPDMPR